MRENLFRTLDNLRVPILSPAVGLDCRKGVFGAGSRLASVFPTVPVLVVTDSWFGNNGLLKPLRQALGERAQVLTRLRVNNTLYALPPASGRRKGRPRKYGDKTNYAKLPDEYLVATQTDKKI